MATFIPTGFKRSGVGRQLCLIAVSLAIVGAFASRSGEVDLPAIYALFNEFSIGAWLMAAVLTVISLAAVGRYDVIAAHYLNLNISERPALNAGWRATAIAQTLGFGLFTGALVRWKLLSSRPEFTLWQATQMTGVVTACFFGGWAVVTSAAIVATPSIAPQIWWLGLLGIWTTLCLCLWSTRSTKTARLPVPPLRLLARISGLALVDTLAACLVIYYFLPEGYIPFLTLYSAFLLAYCAGMLSGIPGGLGSFELCLTALLPITDATPMLAALLGYRAIYFAAPALAAIATVKLSKFDEPRRYNRPTPIGDTNPPPAETALLSQGQLHVIDDSRSPALCLGRQTKNSEILMRDPFRGKVEPFLKARLEHAHKAFRGLLAYKISQNTASIASKLGMTTHQISSEAILHPMEFSLDTPKRSQLRRKLRTSAKACVHVALSTPTLEEIHDIDADWQSRNGPPRGFSIGSAKPDLMAQQVVFTAYQNEVPIAYMSFHQSRERWVLDVMRSRSICPDGTNHALIHGALQAAKARNVPVLSLCSVPMLVLGAPKTWVERLIKRAYAHGKTARGLYRFKSSFAPDWQRQYIAADSYRTLLMSGFELFRLIHAPLQELPLGQDAPHPHNHYDDYQFDSSSLLCEEAS